MIFIVKTDSQDVGGVQLLEDRLSRAITQGSQGSAEEAVEAITTGRAKTVFTQQEGGLSPAYAAWAEELLALGATVVEQNIFALESEHRPQHERYVHALMSQDGVHRYVLRSVARGLSPLPRWLHLPKPALHEVDSSDRDALRASMRWRHDAVVLLRVGRADPRKWTDFEVDFGNAFAEQTGRPTILALVGSDGPTKARRLHPKLEISALPVGPVAAYYAAADAYVHHSRIGETYGNTIVEAQVAGLAVVVGLDLAWDCAPLELTRGHRRMVGTTDALLRRARALDGLISRSADIEVIAGVPAAQTAKRINEAVGLTVETPSFLEALKFMHSEGRELGNVAGVPKAIAREVVRSWRRAR